MLFIFQKEEKNSQLKLACRLSRQAAVKISKVVHFCLFHLFHNNYFSGVNEFCDVKTALTPHGVWRGNERSGLNCLVDDHLEHSPSIDFVLCSHEYV